VIYSCDGKADFSATITPVFLFLIICNFINAFTVNLDQLNPSLHNKSIIFFLITVF